MSDAIDVFYVVRKGDIIGVYKSLDDFQAEIHSSVCDRPVSVYRGHGLFEDAKNHLLSCGLRNAAYCISANDMKDDLLGELLCCNFEPPNSSTAKEVEEVCPQKRSRTQDDTQDIGCDLNYCSKDIEIVNDMNLDYWHEYHPGDDGVSCILKFDGASKGNPGPSGAGAVLYDTYGSLLHEWAEGVGPATNNVAEYRGLILGLRKALDKGFRHIKIFGDSNLVVMQVQGKWKLKNKNMADLCSRAKDILTKFISFDISYIPREMNGEADKMANSAISLKDGEVCEASHSFYE